MTTEKNTQLFSSVLALTIHDIKNSLALLLDKVEEMQNECDMAAGKATQSKYEVRRINHNLVRLLGLYKIGASQYAPAFDFHDVSDLLDEVASDYREMLTGRKINIDVECNAELQGRFDKQLMFSILENALNNASRYAKTRIRVSAQQEDDWVNIRVEDDGGGFPPHLLELNNDDSGETPFNAISGNTGLGFYFASVAADLHQAQGNVGYFELVNGGLFGGGQFVIHLPQEKDTGFDFDF